MSEASDRKTRTYEFYELVATKLIQANSLSERLDVVAWALEEKRAWGSATMSVASDRILAQLKADLGAI
jgi:hypothetical protein